MSLHGGSGLTRWARGVFLSLLVTGGCHCGWSSCDFGGDYSCTQQSCTEEPEDAGPLRECGCTHARADGSCVALSDGRFRCPCPCQVPRDGGPLPDAAIVGDAAASADGSIGVDLETDAGIDDAGTDDAG